MSAEHDTDGLGIFPREIAASIYRKRYWLIPPVLIGLLLAAIVVLHKPQYRSSATLLIDSQQIPTSIVAAPLASVANERIGKIRQQVLSRDRLSQLVKDNNLFPEERAAMPADDVLKLVRDAIGVNLVSANEGQGGNGGGSTIAFTVSFTYSDPVKARAVTEQLTQMFLREDKRYRTEQATGTATFLEHRANELRRQLAALEDDRRGVEARYAGALPDQVALSAQAGSALRAEISRIDAETQGLSQQSSLLAVQADGETRTQPGAEALRRAEERLNQLTSTYADNYPEVVAARAAVERQRASLARDRETADHGLLQREITSSHARAQMLQARRAELVQSITDLDRRTAQAPQAAYELNMIEREYDNIRRQYESLREKQLDAQVAVNLQSEDKGERFSVVDEPSLPYSQLGARPSVALLAGLVAGLAAGIAIILAHDLYTGTIHGSETLSRILDAPILGVVPVTNRVAPLTWLTDTLKARQQQLAGIFMIRRTNPVD